MKVLIVDDDAADRQACADQMRLERVSVLETDSAERGLELVEAEAPDVVVTAYPMPLRDGRTLTAVLLERPAAERPLVVAHTSWSWSRTLGRARDEGCDAVLRKPTPAREILARSRRLLRQRRAVAPTVSVTTPTEPVSP
jgi:CheY-like chemotaxis protein